MRVCVCECVRVRVCGPPAVVGLGSGLVLGDDRERLSNGGEIVMRGHTKATVLADVVPD